MKKARPLHKPLGKSQSGAVQLEYVIVAAILIPIFAWVSVMLATKSTSAGEEAKDASEYLMGCNSSVLRPEECL